MGDRRPRRVLPAPGWRPSAATAASALLVAVTAVWGSTFFLIHGLVETLPVADFLTVRFALATVVTVLLAPRALARLRRRSLARGLVLGLLYGTAQLLQTAGLAHTAAAVSGFVTGMYVVFTPLLAGLVLRQRIGRLVGLAVVLAVAGLGLLALRGLSFGYGEALTLAAAAIYAVHIVLLSRWSTGAEALGLSIVQLAVITALCGVAAAVAAPPGGFVLPHGAGQWLAVGYLAVAAGALAIVAQTWAQAHLAPTRAAVVMCLEPVWAAFFAVLAGGETLTGRLLGGGGLVVAGMLLAEVGSRPRHPDTEAPHIAV